MIQLRAGAFYLNTTLTLSASDSGLTIAAYQNEEAVISGGVHLTGLNWTKSSANPKIWVTPAKVNLDGKNGGFISSAGALPAGNDIRKANMTIVAAEAWCQANSSCAGFTVRVAGLAGSIKEVYFKSKAGAEMPNSEWSSYESLQLGVGQRSPRWQLCNFHQERPALVCFPAPPCPCTRMPTRSWIYSPRATSLPGGTVSSCPLPAAPGAPARGGHRHNFPSSP